MSRFRFLYFAFVLLLLPTSSESAVLLLKDGGTLEGELLNPDEISRKTYQIQTAEGITITLDARLVDRIQRRERDALIEYDTKAPFSEHTLDNHLYWARWCGENQLPNQAKIHWRQVLEIEPDNVHARSVLGYIKNPAGSGWVLQQDRLESRGFVLDKGRWRTAYQIEVDKILENKKSTELHWQKTVRDLCRKLPNEQAEAELWAIREPVAFTALRDVLVAEQNPQRQIFFLRLFIHSSYTRGIQFAAGWTIRPDGTTDEVRQTCLEELQKQIPENPDIRQMMLDVYRSSLHPNTDPSVIQLAAQAVDAIEGYEAVAELIDVLVVIKTQVHQPPKQGIEGGKGITWGQPKPITIRTPIQNQAALTALQKLTGANFGFDQAAWKEWYRQSKRAPSFNLRRY